MADVQRRRTRWCIGAALLVVAVLAPASPAATQVVSEPRNVFAFGDAPFVGSDTGSSVNGIAVGLAPTPGGQGYWTAASDGGVFSFGDARFHGSAGAIRLQAPVVGIAATPSGAGYWLAAADGGVFAYGDAPFLGSMGGRHLARPVVGVAAAPDGRGYWLVADDGGVFAFGTARFAGSAAPLRLRQRVVGMAAAPGGGGYWLAARDGGVFAFGTAAFAGSAATRPLRRPVSAIAATPDGRGYWLAARDGEVLAFGTAPALGRPSPEELGRQVASIVAVAATPSGRGYWLLGTHLVGEEDVFLGRAGAACDAVFPVRRRIGREPGHDRLAALLEGPTPEERAQGYTSPFSLETAGHLQSRRVEGGVARVDLDDLSAAIPVPSACTSAAVLAQLDATTIGPDIRVERVVYAFDGDVAAFYAWLGMAPPR